MFFQKLLRRLNGMHYSQDYLCLAREQHSQPLHTYLVRENIAIKDITNLYLMVGICPLIIALPELNNFNLDSSETIEIFYSIISMKEGRPICQKNIVGKLKLKKLKVQKTGCSVYYFEGVHGTHKLLPAFNQIINKLYNTLYNKKKGNIFLNGNLYTQMQIVYSIPQVISLITVGEHDLYNIFPTDQHGQINDNCYVITLRHAGKACTQAETAKKIVLSNIKSFYFKEVYGYGKNHMQPLKEKSKFNFSNLQSQVLQLPLPQHTIEYRELELQDSFIYGIHKIFLFKILSHQENTNNKTTLSCINNVYATWRYKHKLPNDHLMS